MLSAKDSAGESRGKQSSYFLGSYIKIMQLKQLLEVIPEQSLKSCWLKQHTQPSTMFGNIF